MSITSALVGFVLGAMFGAGAVGVIGLMFMERMWWQ